MAYSTTSHKSAYETDKNNSIYVQVLKESLNRNIPISIILDKVKRGLFLYYRVLHDVSCKFKGYIPESKKCSLMTLTFSPDTEWSIV